MSEQLTCRQLNRALKIAREVRKWAEKLAADPLEGFPEDLCGLCARASWRLHTLLRAEGIPSYVMFGRGHAFVYFQNGYVLDVTATQFHDDLPKVLYAPRCDLVRKWDSAWVKGRKYKHFKAIYMRQKREDWPLEQRARRREGVL